MDIGDYIAIYATIIATTVFLWQIIQNRKYLKLAYEPTGEGDDFSVDVHVTNKTSQPIELVAIMMGKYRRDYKHYSNDVCQVVCEFRTFYRKVKGVIGKVRAPLEENERGVFWINVKVLREQYPAKKFPFRYICFFDSYGRTHRYKLPKKIMKILNHQ